MVVFTCGHCGESVNKPKVEKHYLTKCRNRNPNLSCMDCFKDFLGNDYEQHTKCVTEEQRYAAKGFVAKEKKGEQKQNVWVELVQSVLDEQKSAPRNVLKILETVSKHNNTPRKKPKFINFVKNVCGHKTNPKDIDSAWDMISVKLSELSSQNQHKKPDKIEADESEIKLENNETINGDKDEAATNGHDDLNEKHEQNGSEASGDGKKKSKKQRKEEKKQKKYAAELQSAAVVPSRDEEEETEQLTKKQKKKKNRTNSVCMTEPSEEIEEVEGNKNKKRKRQDTVNSVTDVAPEGETDLRFETLQINGEKTKKKKPKVEDPEESICLHDQNVAKAEENHGGKGEKFNWHAVIMSVLQKKGDEVPFKRLQKKVLGEYSEATGQDIDDRIADKFIKKLRSCPNVRVDKNRVLIIE